MKRKSIKRLSSAAALAVAAAAVFTPSAAQAQLGGAEGILLGGTGEISEAPVVTYPSQLTGSWLDTGFGLANFMVPVGQFTGFYDDGTAIHPRDLIPLRTQSVTIVNPNGTPAYTVNNLSNGTTASNGLTAPGLDVELGGTLERSTNITQGAFNLTTTGTGNIGFGTTSPASKLEIVSAIAGAGDDVRMSVYGAGGNPGFITVKAAGTEAAPANIAPGDGSTTGTLLFNGYVGGSEKNLGGLLLVYTGDGITQESQTQFRNSGTVQMLLNTEGNLGIGAGNPLQKLHVGGNALIQSGVLQTFNSGSYPTAGVTSTNYAGMSWNTVGVGVGETEFVNTRGAGGANSTAFRFFYSLGAGAPTAADDIATISQTGAYTAISDRRVKSNIANTGYGLSTIMKLRPVEYDHHLGNSVGENGEVVKGRESIHDVGFIAQEVEEILPLAVEKPTDTPGALYHVAYTKMIPILTKAVQEQQAQIEALKAENASLRQLAGEMKEIKALIAALEDKSDKSVAVSLTK